MKVAATTTAVQIAINNATGIPRNEWRKLYRRYLTSEPWARVRDRILAQRGYACEICDCPEKLHVHHLTYIHVGFEHDDDLQVLCGSCHMKIHGLDSKSKNLAIKSEKISAQSALNHCMNRVPVKHLNKMNIPLTRMMKEVVMNPALAEEWKAFNSSNRKFRPPLARSYRNLMLDGEWKDNGNVFRFSDKGLLMDGQHRLQACIDANYSFNAFVIYGLPHDSFDTIDCGAGRSAKDVLDVAQESNATLLSSVLSLLFAFDKETGFSSSNMPRTKILPTLAQHAAIREHVKWAGSIADKASPLTPTLWAFIRYKLFQFDEALAEDFCHKLKDGELMHSGHPVFALRNRLINAKLKDEMLSRRTIIAFLIKGWNAYLTNSSVFVYKFLEGQAFPKFLSPSTKTTSASSY